MRNKKAIFAGALMVPALALTGGVAYATTGGPATPARTAVTATAQPTSHHPAGQIHYRCDWRYGDHRCDQRGHPHQQPAIQRPATQRQPTRHPPYRHHANRSHHGYQGGMGYHGSGRYGNGSQWGNGSGCCGDGW